MNPVQRLLRPPKMTGTEALACLATRGPGHRLQALAEGQEAQLRLLPLPPGQALQAAAGTQRLQMEWAGGQLAMDLAPQALDQWLALVLGVPELEALPENFRPVAVEHIARWALGQLATDSRGPGRLISVEAAMGRPEQAPHAVQLELELPERQFSAVLHMDSLALMLVASLVQAQAPAEETTAMESLPLALHLCIGQTQLPLDQMHRLQTGGLVFIDHSHLGGGDGLLLCAAAGPQHRLTVQARVDGHQLLILSSPAIMNTEATDETADESLSLEQMPVELSFDLGRKMMSLQELKKLSEGQAVPLDQPLQQAVTIRANGAVIGQGQLLDIDGRVGVLISQLHAPKTAGQD